MGQIVQKASNPVRCNLAAIQTGGSQANVVLDDGEVWFVDTTNAEKGTDGYGHYDAYIVGDGTKKANALVVTPIDDMSAFATKQELATKQDTINDLATIRSGASSGATAYQKPSGGVPKTDLAAAVLTSLGKADAALSSSDMATINGSRIDQGGNVTIIAAEGQTITIDAAPTKDSNNAVSSGGVYSEVSQLSQNVDQILAVENNHLSEDFSTEAWQDGYYVYSEGVSIGSLNPSSINSASNFIDIGNFAGGHLIYTRGEYTNASILSGLCFYDSQKHAISGVTNVAGAAQTGYSSYTADIPGNAKYVRFTFPTSLKTSFSAIGSIDSVDSARLKKMESALLDTASLGSNEWTSGAGIVAGHGTTMSSTTLMASGFIDVSRYTGLEMVYKRVKHTVASSSFGVAFYDKNHSYLSGQLMILGAATAGYEDTTIEIPTDAVYFRASWWQDTTTYGNFSASVTYSLGYTVSVLRTTTDSLCDAVFGENSTSHSDSECLARFITAMNEKCSWLGITGQTIGGPSGYGNGAGYTYMPIYGMAKIMAAAIGYPFLANVWSEDSRVIRTAGTQVDLTIHSAMAESVYSDDLTGHYDVLGWKTGTVGALTNLAVAVTSDALKGAVLVGVISRTYADFQDNGDVEGNNRYLAMRYLLDIGEMLYENRGSDISSLEALLSGQGVTSAVVITIPNCSTRLIHHIDIEGSDYFNLYSYSPTTINTMSMVKLLTAIVTLDYVGIDGLDKYVTIKSSDISAAAGGSADIFAAGEKVTYRDLLYAMLLPSSNQAGYILARKIGQKLLDSYRGSAFIPE